MQRRQFCAALAVMLFVVASMTYGQTESEFLWISDIHFDPMVDPALVCALVKARASKWETILERTKPESFSSYGTDTNWWLLKSAVEQFPKTEPRPAFVIVTGDLLAHNFPDTFEKTSEKCHQQPYRKFVFKTVQFLALQLQRRFPNTKIYITPGNNDNDSGNYSISPNGAFLHDTAKLTRKLARGGGELGKQWKALGSFNVQHPTLSNVRLISLDSIVFSQKYKQPQQRGCAANSGTAALALMKWLESNLAAAEKSNKKVWLMFHIPPGIDGYSSGAAYEAASKSGVQNAAICEHAIVPMWVPDCTQSFDEWLARYRTTVTAAFAAHTHSDDFRVMRDSGEYLLMNPAISPVYEQNPGFRVVSYGGDGRVTDYTTYYLTNLKDASKSVAGVWDKEYTFTETWQAEINAMNLSKLYEQVVASEDVRSKWLKQYAVRGPAEKSEIPMVRALYCAIEGLSVESYRTCWCGGSN